MVVTGLIASLARISDAMVPNDCQALETIGNAPELRWLNWQLYGWGTECNAITLCLMPRLVMLLTHWIAHWELAQNRIRATMMPVWTGSTYLLFARLETPSEKQKSYGLGNDHSWVFKQTALTVVKCSIEMIVLNWKRNATHTLHTPTQYYKRNWFTCFVYTSLVLTA